MNFRSINQMDQVIRNRLHIIPRDIDCVIGIPRSGMLPATIIALYLNKPLLSIEELKKEKEKQNTFTTRIRFETDKKIKKALVLDDSCNTGLAMGKAKKYLSQFEETEFIYGAIYATAQATKFVDIYFDICEQPRVFEWNIMDHGFLCNAFLDLDGVLCWDPTDEQNDDGERYLDFLRTATPKFLPENRIGGIVTSRLEKYRKETEEWLEKHNIKYDKLYMMDLPDMKTRQKLANHAEFKADIYKRSEFFLFIESSAFQAEKIFNLTSKNVYCIENNCFYQTDN